ncbi:helix-turn-helix transcriptional regulator [Paenibacillus tepidiphilus]|uniref:helix-turn-helix transcriptional regulator n=1 Tax=Paenibacillus tepidiphilus TaxID=2608683 RepID=UPI0012391EBE|nr:helix-turn-helix domain-containing protein [Paenibacillus tepidiphilus]
MRLSKPRTRRALYGKILISTTLCVSLTLLFSTIIYYQYYIRIEKTQAFRTDLGNLTQTSKEVVNMTDAAQSLSFQIYRNSTISKIVFYDHPDIYDVTAAMSELGNYLSSMPYIESIYVYNPKSGQFYIASSEGQNGVFTEAELVDTGILGILNHFEDYKPFTPIPRVFSNGAEENGQVRAYTFICFDAIGWDRTINSAVIVNISAPWINKEIAGADHSESATFILGDRGTFLSGSSLEAHPLSGTELGWMESRIKDREAGYFLADFGGINSLISYTAPDALNWQYVRITPYEVITRQTDHIRNATLLIAGLILAGGIGLSWLMSRQMYLPIDRMVREMHALECEKRDSMFTIRQNALRDMVLGLRPLHITLQDGELRQLGIHFAELDDYRLLLLRIDHYGEFRVTHAAYLQAYKFAVMNIASEICSQTCRAETVDMNDDSVLVLLGGCSSAGYADNEFAEALLGQIRQACADYLKLSLTLTYSSVERSLGQLPEHYKLVRDASRHRMFYGHGCIISASRIAGYQDQSYRYPTELEKKLVDALMSGRTEEAKTLLGTILREPADYPFSAAQQTVSRLSVTIKEVISTIQKRNRLQGASAAELPPLEAFETLEELETAFFVLFREIEARLAEKKNSKQHELVRLINQKVQESYMSQSLSLNSIADELDMSPIYISRLYKQQTMTSIVDSILEMRLREVCRLLETTELPVTAIAERCGFTSSSYLHRMFKRSFGATPNDYRRSHNALG